MDLLSLFPLGLLQSAPSSWPTAVLFIISWVKIGGVVWAANSIIKTARGHGEMGDKFPDMIMPGLVIVGLMAPDTLTRLLGVGQNSGLLTALSAWQLVP